MSIAAENPLGLRIPEQSPPQANSMTRPKEVSAWIQSLPMASGTDTAKKLYKTLQSINRTRLPAQDRLQIAQLFTAPIQYAISTLERKFIGNSFPLSDKARLTALVCMRLNEEAAYLYKAVVRDIAAAKIGSRERKIMVIALYRAVQHLAELVFQTAQIYEPYPKHIWRELHNLFAFAQTNRWSELRLKNEVNGEEVVSTLKSTYTQILLFAAASPYRLRQRETRQLYRLLPDWGEHVQVSINTPSSEPDACFIVQLKQDLPPVHISLANQPLKAPFLALDNRKLIQHLQTLSQELAGAEENPSAGLQDSQRDLSEAMVKRLIQTLGQAPHRQFVRTHLNFNLEIAVGLSKIHRLISGQQTNANDGANFGSPPSLDASELNPESVFATDFLDNESGLTLVPMDTQERVYLRGYESYGLSSQPSPPAPREPVWGSTGTPRPRPGSTATLQTLNESAGGYCVQWNGEHAPGIGIGELIGIQAPSNPNSYGLAVARWMRREASSGLQLGVQLIAPSTYAITATSTERRQRTPIACLLAPELKNANRPASLVAPAMSLQVGMGLQIRHQDTEQRIKLTRLIESTGAFSQFQFDYV